MDLDALDAVQVHGDGADVAGQLGAPAVGEPFMVSATLEPKNCSVSKPAWPSTTSLPSPGIPDEAVVAVAEEGDVAAPATDHGVVALAAEQQVVAGATGDLVVARRHRRS